MTGPYGKGEAGASPAMAAGRVPGLIVRVDDEGIARIVFDLPGAKINKLSSQMMRALGETFDELAAQARAGSVKGVLLLSGKPGMFIAGADIAEIEGVTDPDEGAAKAREGQQIFDRLEAIPVPSVCAVPGPCLGGGYELALACTRIIVADDPKVQVGLPEVRIGIFPGFGGTQRLPRRAGLRSALAVILAGKTLNSRRALKAGLVDAVVPTPILARVAEEELRRLAGIQGPGAGSSKPRGALPGARRAPSWTERLAGRLLDGTPPGRAIVASKARKTVAKQAPEKHYPAPYRALEATLAGYRMKREKAYENEARLVGQMLVTPTSKSLISLFNAQTAAKKVSSEISGTSSPEPLPVEKAGVLGAGIMGAGIAQVAVSAGVPVRLKDVEWAALSRGLETIASGFRARVKRRRMDRGEFARRMNRVSVTTDWSGFSACDLLIEAVVEKIEVKWAVLAEAEAVLRDDALFATNTSSLLVGDIASKARVPGRVVGLHFFNPAPRMPLVEVVAGPATVPAALARAAAFVTAIGKVPVVVKDGPGFLVNRLLMPYLGQALALAESGGNLGAIDEAATDWGLPMGPFRLLDEIGLDIARHASTGLASAFPERAAPSAGSLDMLVEAGLLGAKTGAGFYRHRGKARGRKSEIDASAVALVRSGPKREGVAPPSDSETLMDLLVLPIVNEAAQCLEEEIVRGPREADLAMVMGTGFPPFRGGPLRHADSLGASEVCRRLDALAETYGDHLRPVAHLRKVASGSDRFHS